MQKQHILGRLDQGPPLTMCISHLNRKFAAEVAVHGDCTYLIIVIRCGTPPPAKLYEHFESTLRFIFKSA